ncbi:MAG TPA: S8 family serine peptidase [Puia sp.]|jgi:subtilisin family serine protease
MALKKNNSQDRVITVAPPAKVIPNPSIPAIRRRTTGRLLVRLNPAASLESIEKKANARSLRLVSLRDLPAGLSKGLENADGILFERLKIALVNPSAAGKIKRLLALRDSPFLSSEPEHCLYKAAGAKRPVFKNTAAATWGIQAINVRSSKATGKDVRIAVLDTGFDFTHPDFAGRVIHRKSFVGRQAKDREGHGTFCVGVAGGDRKGKSGARYGVASGARLYVGKILDDAGEGSDGSALAGIEWALEKGCQVISMSFGAAVESGSPYSEIFEDVAKTAMANNCLLIAATGNESDREEGMIAPVNHPANCPSVMAVAALTEGLKVANYSCGGKGGTRRKMGPVNIAAPGDNILSAHIGGGYAVESGTSMATPFVAGVAALLWQQYPGASAREIWDKLIGQAQPLAGSVADVGAGLVYMP